MRVSDTSHEMCVSTSLYVCEDKLALELCSTAPYWATSQRVFENASALADSSDASALADSTERGRLASLQSWTSSAWLLLCLASRIQH